MYRLLITSIWIVLTSKTLSIHILENQNHYAEFHFGIPDQFMIHVTEYLFSGVYTVDTVDVVIAAITDTLRAQLIIGQNVNRKVAVIPHVV